MIGYGGKISCFCILFDSVFVFFALSVEFYMYGDWLAQINYFISDTLVAEWWERSWEFLQGGVAPSPSVSCPQSGERARQKFFSVSRVSDVLVQTPLPPH